MNESPVRSVKDLMLENEALREDNDTLFETNEDLIRKNHNLEKMIIGLKKSNKNACIEQEKMSAEILRLSKELQTIKQMGVWEFANKYCSDEENSEAGKQLAKSLLGGA